MSGFLPGRASSVALAAVPAGTPGVTGAPVAQLSFGKSKTAPKPAVPRTSAPPEMRLSTCRLLGIALILPVAATQTRRCRGRRDACRLGSIPLEPRYDKAAQGLPVCVVSEAPS